MRITPSARITNWIMKIPQTVAAMLNLSNLIDKTSGMAISPYRKNIDRNEKTVALLRENPILLGSISPINIKLNMLNMVPRINPFPIGFKPNRKKDIPTKIAMVIAMEQYFF